MMEINKQIGKRIRERRKELNITQMQIQKRTGLSSGNQSCIENGQYLPSAQALILLSDALDCSVDWILKGKSSISKTSDITHEKEKRLVTGFCQLPATEQDEILEIMEMKLRKVKGDAQKLGKLSSSGGKGNNKVG